MVAATAASLVDCSSICSDASKAILAPVGCAVISSATNARPVVGTIACCSCIGVAGFDRINKLSFAIHFSTPEQCLSADSILMRIRELATKTIDQANPIELHLRGGIAGISDPIFYALELWIKSTKVLPLKVVSRQKTSETIPKSTDKEAVIAECGPQSRDFLLDTRTGAIYDLPRRVYPITKTDLDFLDAKSQLAASNTKIEITYAPVIFGPPRPPPADAKSPAK